MKKVVLFSIILLLGTGSGSAGAADRAEVGQGAWSLLGGYGFSHTKLGKTKTWVETVDLVGRYERQLTAEIGSSWYQGRYLVMVETPVHFVVDPAADPMVGLNFLACYRFSNLLSGVAKIYGFGGGGPVYSGSELPGMGRHLNGNWQLGIGLRQPLDSGQALLMEYRFHHISNGGSAEPNDSFNSSKLLLGITF